MPLLQVSRKNVSVLVAIAILIVAAGAFGIWWYSKQPPRPGSCLVFEEKYCSLGQVFEFHGIRYLAFRLPAGVSIFSPFDGTLEVTGNSRPFINPDATLVSVHNSSGGRKPEDVIFSAIGDIVSKSPGIETPVAKGAVVAITSSAATGKEVFDGHTVAISLVKFNLEEKKWETDSLLNELFP